MRRRGNSRWGPGSAPNRTWAALRQNLPTAYTFTGAVGKLESMEM